MSDFVVVDGDTVTFEATFGGAIFISTPLTTTISGSGSKLASGAIACVEGDEASVTLSNVSYTTVTYTVSGTGTLTVKKLGSDQLAQKLTVGGKKVILVGSKFDATFHVDQAAKTNSSPVKFDESTSYSGKGSFSTGNTKLDSA